MTYQQQALEDCINWQHQMMKKRSSLFGRAGKSLQNKVNEKIPQSVHDVMSGAVKGMVQSMLYGSNVTSSRGPIIDMIFEDRDRFVQEKITKYKRTATFEGVGTGFGGLWWGLADFPLLLGIKMKFLYDVAGIYGFNINDFRERIYLLYIFQVTFSSDQTRVQTFLKMRNWPESISAYSTLGELDWEEFQLEYRDYIDLAKLFQLIPGFGAIVGGIANYRFLDHLGETAMNAYRMRLLDSQ